MIKKSEIRKNYIFNDYVVIAPGRSKRPSDTLAKKKTTPCPFCIKNKQDIILALNNDFPALSPDNLKAYGHHLVLIEGNQHDKSLGELSPKLFTDLINVYTDESQRLAKDKKISYVLIFKNQGSQAGASMRHPHSQILASALIPAELQEEIKTLKDYRKKYKKCAYCEILKKEAKSSRLVYRDKYFTVFTPYASRYNYEVWILSNRHVDNLALLTAIEKNILAQILQKLLKKIDKLGLDYNYFMHNVVPYTDQHFYLKIEPRQGTWGGVELGSGLVLNPVSPEEAAKYYKF